MIDTRYFHRRAGRFHNLRPSEWGLVGIVLGLKLMVDFDLTPGASGSPPVVRPEVLGRATDGARPLVAMFVHSKCPCSRASLAELHGIVASSPGTADVHIYFREPDATVAGHEDSALWRQAAEIPGAILIREADGRTASRLNVRTSGHVLVYAATGELRFSGGITAARGHGGENPGRAAVKELLTGGRPIGTQHTVFGCPLFESECPTASESPCPPQK